MGRLLAALIQAGVRVNQFREEQSDLEDTFLSITRVVSGEKAENGNTNLR
jgi:hypothetical protein